MRSVAQTCSFLSPSGYRVKLNSAYQLSQRMLGFAEPLVTNVRSSETTPLNGSLASFRRFLSPWFSSLSNEISAIASRSSYLRRVFSSSSIPSCANEQPCTYTKCDVLRGGCVETTGRILNRIESNLLVEISLSTPHAFL